MRELSFYSNIATITYLETHHPHSVMLRRRLFIPETGCQPPADVLHGRRKEQLDGGVVSFTCRPGFELTGHAVMYCNGLQWNGTEPSCQRKTTVGER